MRVRLDETHYLVSDANCCWVICTYTNKKGADGEKRVSGYYRTVQECIASYIDRKILSSEVTSLKELQKEINKLKKQVKAWKVAIDGL